jgi:hypothetical protein
MAGPGWPTGNTLMHLPLTFGFENECLCSIRKQTYVIEIHNERRRRSSPVESALTARELVVFYVSSEQNFQNTINN